MSCLCPCGSDQSFDTQQISKQEIQGLKNPGQWVLFFGGTGFYWFFGRVLKYEWQLAIAKCYSHQVNPEMENDYCVFIVNYVYWLCTGTVLIL